MTHIPPSSTPGMAGLLRNKRLLGFSLLALAIGGALLWLPGSSSTKPAAPHAPEKAALRVSTVLAQTGTLAQTIAVTGSVVARDEIAIGTALQDQRIAAVLAEAGDSVQAGQVLARLETQTLDAQLQQAQAAVQRGLALVAQQEALQAEAQASWERIDPLNNSGAVSAQQIDQQRAQARSAAANLAAARAEHAQAKAQLADAQAQRQKAEVRAPVAGVISERAARIGALSGDEPLFKLIREGQLELDGEIAEAALSSIAPGSVLQVQVEGVSGTVEGRVRLVAPKVDATSRQGRVRIALARQPGVRAGSFASASIAGHAQDAAVLVPQRAVTFGQRDAASVMTLDKDGRVTPRKVTLGQRNGVQVEVKAGLAAGERIVAAASAFIREGDVVSFAGQGERRQ